MAKLSELNKQLTFVPEPSSPDTVGTVQEIPESASVPDGWLEANGQYVNEVDYPELFALYGTAFDPSPPAGTFKLPGGSYTNNLTNTGTMYSSGNVGIGTSPSTQLHLASSSGSVVRLQNTSTVGVNDDVTGKVEFFSSDLQQNGITGSIQSRQDGGTGDWHKLSFHTAGAGGDDVQRMVINGDGKVGIGTTDLASAHQLKVDAGSLIPARFITSDPSTGILDASGARIEIQNTNSTNGNLGEITFHNANATNTVAAAMGVKFQNHTTSPTADMYFNVRNGGTYSTALYMEAGGNIGIGTTNTGSGKLTIRTPNNAPLYFAHAQTGSYSSAVHRIEVDTAASSSYDFLLGYSSGADLEFRLRGDGNGTCDGSWTGGGADYAEYFESVDGSELEYGTCVVLDGLKVRAFDASVDSTDSIMGVVRPKNAACIVGNSAWNKWEHKYLKNDFGGYELDENGHRQLNPDYDDSMEYVPREDRPEWNLIGLLGQIEVKKGETVRDSWIFMGSKNANADMYLVR